VFDNISCEKGRSPLSIPFVEAFSDLPDPRVHHNKIRHKLLDVITMTVAAVLGGADNWADVVDFAHAKQNWFEEFLELPNGIPSHDTFSRVFSLIDPEAFGQCFLAWVRSIAKRKGGRVVPIDGKTLRRSHDGGEAALHVVSAFCTANRLVLGQIATEEKSNEITAIPKLLDVLDVRKAIVTIDAMGAQKAIVAKIVERKADYVIGLKANQPKFLEAVEAIFEGVHLDTSASKYLDVHVIDEKGHGRERVQGTFVTTRLDGIPAPDDWLGLSSVAMVITEWIDKDGRPKTERRFYISSLTQDAQQSANAIRSHWGIENSLHWVLDVVFREDDSRVRRDNGALNLAVIRHGALNLIRQDKKTKASVRSRRNRAGWNNDYLASLLFAD
jgi:predicted transposase YbfD/YdcC